MRYWWVVAKLVINVVLVTLVLLVLWPSMISLGEAGRVALASGDSPVAAATLLFPPVVSSTVAIVAMTLSVFKPWGPGAAITLSSTSTAPGCASRPPTPVPPEPSCSTS